MFTVTADCAATLPAAFLPATVMTVLISQVVGVYMNRLSTKKLFPNIVAPHVSKTKNHIWAIDTGVVSPLSDSDDLRSYVRRNRVLSRCVRFCRAPGRDGGTLYPDYIQDFR